MTDSTRTQWTQAVEQVLVGLRRHDIRHIEMRVALAILEFSLCKSREAAIFPQQNHIGKVTQIPKQNVSLAVQWLEEKSVIQRKEGLYSFCLPTSIWRVRLRVKEGKQLELMDLEGWLADPALRQLPLIPDLNVKETLTRSVIESLTPVSKSLTNPVSKSLTPVSKSLTDPVSKLLTDPPTHIYVDHVGVRLRNTSDGQRAGEILGKTFAWFAEDKAIDLKSEKNNPIWRKLASLADFPNPLEQALTDCKLCNTETKLNRAARLMDSVKPLVGPEKWQALFRNSRASWDRVT